MSSSALPLNVTPSSTPAKTSPDKESAQDKTPVQAPAMTKQLSTKSNPNDISSPHELTAYVEKLLEQLDSKFDEMSSQVLDRMAQMSQRVDALEASIQDIINGDITSPSLPQSPSPANGHIRKNT